MSTHPSAAPLLMQAGNAYNAGDLQRALALAAQLAAAEPGHAEAHYLAGLAAIALGRTATALEHFGKATALDEQRADYAVQLARALCADRQYGDALVVANRALGLGVTDPVMLGNLGCVYLETNAHERALAAFRQAAALAPGNLFSRFNLALSLVFTGDTDAAEKELEACIALQPRFWHAHAILSQARKQTPQRNHLDRLQSLAASAPREPEAALYLHAAMGKEHEDLGDHADAFVHFTRGKAAIAKVLGYQWRHDRSLIDALIEAFPQADETPGHLSDEPIFIVGLPRTGTTLVERIISSHPEVYSAGELENFGVALAQLAGAGPYAALDPALVQSARAIPAATLGERYVASTRPQTALKPHFIDKRPHNFLLLGFIAQALPRAKIICLRRDPMDTCLSNLREPFNPASPVHRYAFDLMDIGHYYVGFDRLMAHWKTIFPGRILEIDYESIVDDLEGNARRLIDHCGLPWDDRCLQFERNAAASATASSTQVRSPIYRTSVRRWLRYRQEMAPLQQLLEAEGIAVGAPDSPPETARP